MRAESARPSSLVQHLGAIAMRNRQRAAALLGAGLVIVGAVSGVVYWSERSTLWANRHGYHLAPPVAHQWYPYPVPPVERPPVVSVEGATLEGDEEVIGVEVGGRPRAYRLAALRDRQRHVVNDVIVGVPVSVAYCDLTDCVRVYTEPGGSAPLDVAVAGLLDGELVVKLRGVLYVHRTGALVQDAARAPRLPYETLDSERMSWREWARRHPGTDVYQGNAPPGR